MHDESLLLPPETQPELPDGKPVVLIVDDTPDNLALLSDTLQAAGYAVLVALDGQSALQRLARITPDGGPARRADARHGWLRNLSAHQGRSA